MPKRIAIFGGSFNPPGVHHRKLAEALARHFDEVRVVPCGPRPDKPTLNLIPPVFRAALADITFCGLRHVVVDLFDLEQDSFSRSIDLQTRYAPMGEIWHVVGTDLIEGGARGRSPIQLSWKEGRKLWKTAHFAILSRPGHKIATQDLPPHHRLIEVDIPGASTDIRDLIGRGKPVSDWLTPRAEEYIERYGLYRAPVPGSWAPGTLKGCPFQIQTDARNAKATQFAERIRKLAPDKGAPRFIATIGGDGAMLRAIRQNWRRRLPFFGINAGHRGFLMNRSEGLKAGTFPPDQVVFRQLPMLYLEFTDANGKTKSTYGFNDAWVERSTSQSAWLEVTVNGVRRIPKLVSDGALVATAAGSTAYARSMGASPLLADTPAWLLVGSNVMEPSGWKNALLSTDTTVEVRCLDPKKRPIKAFVDGEDAGTVVSFRARISRAASAELVFHSSHDMAEKIAAIQFSSQSR